MVGQKKRSKKPSATKSWRPDPSRVYFLDENLGGVVIGDALRAMGATVEVHKNHFLPGTDDVTWLQEVTRRGWTVITRDQKIRTRPNEIAVIREIGARVVVVTGGNLSGPDLAQLLGDRLKAIESSLISNPAANILTVGKSGRISEPSLKKKARR